MATSSCAPARHASVRPSSSAPHSAFLVARIAAGEFLAIFSASSCAASRSPSGGSTTWRDHPELRAPAPRACARERPTSAMRMIGSIGDLVRQADALVRRHLPERHVRVEERRVARRDHDVGVGDEVQPAAGAHAVDRGDHRLPHLVVPRGEAQLGVAGAARLLAQRLLVAAQLRRRRARSGTSRPSPVLTITRTSGSASSSRHASSSSVSIVRVHRVADVGPVEDQPADGALPLDDEALVHLSDRRSRETASRGTRRGPRGSRRCATTAPCANASLREVRVERRRRARVQQPLREPERDGGARRELADQLVDRGVELGRGHRAVDHRPTRRPRRRRRRGRAGAARGRAPRRRDAGSSHVAPLSGVKPRSTNGSQKRASSAATVKSAASASWNPMPAAQPRTVHTTGTCTSHEQRDQAVGLRRQPALDAAGTRLRRSPSAACVAGDDVGAGAEVVARAAEHDRPAPLRRCPPRSTASMSAATSSRR